MFSLAKTQKWLNRFVFLFASILWWFRKDKINLLYSRPEERLCQFIQPPSSSKYYCVSDWRAIFFWNKWYYTRYWNSPTPLNVIPNTRLQTPSHGPFSHISFVSGFPSPPPPTPALFYHCSDQRYDHASDKYECVLVISSNRTITMVLFFILKERQTSWRTRRRSAHHRIWTPAKLVVLMMLC